MRSGAIPNCFSPTRTAACGAMCASWAGSSRARGLMLNDRIARGRPAARRRPPVVPAAGRMAQRGARLRRVGLSALRDGAGFALGAGGVTAAGDRGDHAEVGAAAQPGHSSPATHQRANWRTAAATSTAADECRRESAQRAEQQMEFFEQYAKVPQLHGLARWLAYDTMSQDSIAGDAKVL